MHYTVTKTSNISDIEPIFNKKNTNMFFYARRRYQITGFMLQQQYPKPKPNKHIVIHNSHTLS
jgi:hypothetical protein